MEMLDENILSDARTQLKVFLNISFHSIAFNWVPSIFIPDFLKLHACKMKKISRRVETEKYFHSDSAYK